jgi:hypothetical protein
MGDFNSDGLVDLAVSNFGNNGAGNTVSILLSFGDGTFNTAYEIAVGNAPLGLVANDFNSDGSADLAVAHYLSAGTVSVIMGNGDGTFQTPQSYAVGSRPQAVVAADFNSDGVSDLATANYSSGTATILIGVAHGTFDAVTYAVGNFPVALAVGDFDGDGYTDLGVATSDSVVVLLNAADWPPLPVSDTPQRRALVTHRIHDPQSSGISISETLKSSPTERVHLSEFELPRLSDFEVSSSKDRPVARVAKLVQVQKPDLSQFADVISGAP